MLRLVFVLIVFAAQMYALRVPAGTELQIRLGQKISSETANAQQTIKAVVIAPLMVDGQIAVAAGAEVEGIVKEVTALNPSEPKNPATLLLDFNTLQLSGSHTAIATTLLKIDNARETVDADGRIQGMVPSEMLTSRIEQGIGKLEQKYSGLASILQAAKGTLVKDSDASITYDVGTEMTLKLNSSVDVPAIQQAAPQGFANETALAELVNRQPFQTYATRPAVKSDITNLMFIGTKEALLAAFSKAGWANSDTLNDRSKFKTAQAIIEQRGYQEAPVSILILDDRPPDIVYQKGNNTFAARHHLRIWRSPDDFQGRPVWISSSTHDIGIDFSQQSMTFIHKIDPNIDLERAKVVNDLLLTGSVKSLALVPRPKIPQHSRNATGDNLDTDGAMAVLLLQ